MLQSGIGRLPRYARAEDLASARTRLLETATCKFSHSRLCSHGGSSMALSGVVKKLPGLRAWRVIFADQWRRLSISQSAGLRRTARGRTRFVLRTEGSGRLRRDLGQPDARSRPRRWLPLVRE